MNNPILFVDPDGRDNVIYLQGLNSAGLSQKEVKGIVKLANANFKGMGLKTEVKVSRGKELDISKIDKTDAVSVIGAKQDVINTVSKMDADFGKELQQSASFGTGENPEKSENARGASTANIIAISAQGARETSEISKTNFEEQTAFLINHGAGHNSGMNHIDSFLSKEPPFSVMSSGNLIYQSIANPSADPLREFKTLGDFIKTNNNKGVIRQSYINRFGNNSPVAKLPTIKGAKDTSAWVVLGVYEYESNIPEFNIDSILNWQLTLVNEG